MPIGKLDSMIVSDLNPAFYMLVAYLICKSARARVNHNTNLPLLRSLRIASLGVGNSVYHLDFYRKGFSEPSVPSWFFPRSSSRWLVGFGSAVARCPFSSVNSRFSGSHIPSQLPSEKLFQASVVPLELTAESFQSNQ